MERGRSEEERGGETGQRVSLMGNVTCVTLDLPKGTFPGQSSVHVEMCVCVCVVRCLLIAVASLVAEYRL